MSEQEPTTIGKGQVLFRQGDKGGELYFIMQGQIELTVRSDEGEAAVIATLGERQVLGTMSFLEGDLRSATATALSEVKVVIIKNAQREKMLKSVPSWFAVLVKDLSSSMRRLNVEYAHLKSENEQLKKRLAALGKRPAGDGAGEAKKAS